MNLPNFLTIVRILLVPVFVILLLYGNRWGALFTFVAAGVTDALDGLLARLWNQRTRLGAYLDPIADKILLATAFVALAAIREMPIWLVVIVIARDVIILLGFLILVLASYRVEASPTVTSKATTVTQVLSVSLVLFNRLLPLPYWLLQFFFWSVAALTSLSGLQYIYLGTKILEEGD